jgi:hypothetical protein
VALYVADMADTYQPTTISRRMMSIAQAHKAAGYPSPTTDERVRLVNAGIRRVHGVAPRQVRPVVTKTCAGWWPPAGSIRPVQGTGHSSCSGSPSCAARSWWPSTPKTSATAVGL